MWRFVKLGIPKFHEIGFSWSNCTLERSFLLWGSTNYRNSFLKYWFWRSVCGISSLLSHGPSYAIIERSKNMEIWSNPTCSRDGRGVQAAIERLWPRFKKKACPRIYNWKGQFFSIPVFPNLCLAAVAFFCLFFYFAFLLLRFSAFLLVRFPALSASMFLWFLSFSCFFTSLFFCQINTKPTLYSI